MDGWGAEEHNGCEMRSDDGSENGDLHSDNGELRGNNSGCHGDTNNNGCHGDINNGGLLGDTDGGFHGDNGGGSGGFDGDNGDKCVKEEEVEGGYVANVMVVSHGGFLMELIKFFKVLFLPSIHHPS